MKACRSSIWPVMVGPDGKNYECATLAGGEGEFTNGMSGSRDAELQLRVAAERTIAASASTWVKLSKRSSAIVEQHRGRGGGGGYPWSRRAAVST